MRVSGYLVPFPDLGAADLMSDHLEREVQVTGPGRIVMRVSLPRAGKEGVDGSVESDGRYARKKLELFKQVGNRWQLVWEATSDSDCQVEEVSCEVSSSGTLKCRLTNMSGTEGQFSLECNFLPSHQD